MTGLHHQVVAQLIKTIRVEAGLKQTDVSERLGVTQSIVSKSESGERRLDLPELHLICAVCGVPLADFVARFEAQIAGDVNAR